MLQKFESNFVQPGTLSFATLNMVLHVNPLHLFTVYNTQYIGLSLFLIGKILQKGEI
jgi:hypothetical protein